MSRQKIIGYLGLKFNTVAMRQVSNYHSAIWWRRRPMLDCVLKVPSNSIVSKRSKQKSASWLNSDSVAVTESLRQDNWERCLFWFVDLEVVVLNTLEIDNYKLCARFSWRFLSFIPAALPFSFPCQLCLSFSRMILQMKLNSTNTQFSRNNWD